MKRLERLSAVLVHLQCQPIVTAQELAQRFDVSLRTVYRDIRSLETAGIPVGSEPGIGYFLVDGYSLAPAALTFDEIGALLLAGKLAGAFTGTGIQKSLESALYKIKSLLKDSQKAFASEVEKRMGVYGTGEQRQITNNFIQEIQAALFRKTVLEILYQSPSKGETTLRKIDPLALGFYDHYWHLVAFCHLRKAYRDFRVDRIQKLFAVDKSVQESHPPLETILRKMFQSKGLCKTLITLKKENYGIIRERCAFGVVEERDLGDRMELLLMVDSLPVLGRWLFRYGRDVDVLYPQELRAILRQCAEEATKGAPASEQRPSGSHREGNA